MNQYQVERLKPWYPGQLGVAGSDNSLGIRKTSVGIVLYVDDSHARANDDNDGTDSEDPKETIQSAISSAFLVENSLIVIGGGATLAESAIIPNTAPEQCTIMGFGNEQWGPTWTSGAAGEDALTIRQAGWTIANIRFNPPSAAAAIMLEHDAATTVSDRTRIINCDFDGVWSGRFGISMNGAPDQVFVLGNRFHELSNANQASFAIHVAATAHANPYMWVVEGNKFFENDNNIGQVVAADRSFNVSLFKDNVFTQGVLNPTAIHLDLRGGSRGENTVIGNYFGGDYSEAGGYYAHAANPGNWVGNSAEDVAAAQVADNSWTIAPPA